MTPSLYTIDIRPGALLATAPAQMPVSELNAALAEHGLYLPIEPLLPDLSLAALIAHNAGGRRRLRYGTIARYLRAATVKTVDEGRWTVPLLSSTAPLIDQRPPSTAPRLLSLTLGGPTLKRATGYGLNRALAGGGFEPGGPLGEVTLSLRPLPAARRALSLRYADLPAAAKAAARLAPSGLGLIALAVREEGGAALLLAELEGHPLVVERQAAELIELAAAEACVELADPWAAWEELAAHWAGPDGLRLSLTLPRTSLASFIAQAQAIAARYLIDLPIWGDLGVGTLHLGLHGRAEGELTQARAVISALAHGLGGALSTELGGIENEELSIEKPNSFAGSTLNAQFSTLNSHFFIQKLQAIVGESYVLTRPEDLGTYARDASIARAAGQPLAVVLPANTAQVGQVLRCAAEYGLSVVTRGAGSGLAGGSTPSEGSIVLALSRLATIQIDAGQMVAHVGAGAVTADLQRAAEALQLYYPPDPSSLGVSTVGGNIACNAGGPRCLKYGVTADYVLALTAVLADGQLIRLGDGLAGQSPDAGLLHLLIGSEGTLAVITEATLRLAPLPPARRTTMAIFDSLDDACATVELIMAGGLIPAGLELMDATTIIAVEEYLELGLPRDAGALLLLLADGEPEAVAAEADALAELARRGGARSVQVARSSADEAALWQARRAVAPALARIRPNRLGEDICVPVSRIAECVRGVQAIAAANDLPIVVFGHAGDGNLHPNILFDSRDPAQVGRVWQAAEAIFALAIELGGTLSGEHGIGTLKRPFMQQALGPAVIALMWRIKGQFDPENRLNPGKVLP